jgi:hypothetical protein
MAGVLQLPTTDYAIRAFAPHCLLGFSIQKETAPHIFTRSISVYPLCMMALANTSGIRLAERSFQVNSISLTYDFAGDRSA